MDSDMERIETLGRRRRQAFTGLVVTVPILWLAFVAQTQAGSGLPTWLGPVALYGGGGALAATFLLWALFVRVRWDLDHDAALAAQVDDERVREAFRRAAWDAWRLTLIALVAAWGLDIFRPVDWRLAASVVTLATVMAWLLRFLSLDSDDE